MKTVKEITEEFEKCMMKMGGCTMKHLMQMAKNMGLKNGIMTMGR